ncbi:hypothetical protein [Streptomyces sp. 891-h]|uniref:hypothetical protein n=1 Tax=Streptomyces sp. 891-h TaxID=2720714 RepID=UPI001FAAB21A|nr:hypothetical protein [Streptomyces sp. 891-h]UNZ21237.1 hypothetical protein HC362_33345 [Streptomyces sp. 891-h]
MPAGAEMPSIVAVTAFVAVAITLTVPERELPTYASSPVGATATPQGPEPTVMVAVAVRVPVSRAVTVPAPKFVT